MKCRITLEGCDDHTTFDMELTDSEKELIDRVAEMANKTSTYGCMPGMSVEVVDGGKEEA